jgi:hypothetical protein
VLSYPECTSHISAPNYIAIKKYIYNTAIFPIYPINGTVSGGKITENES